MMGDEIEIILLDDTIDCELIRDEPVEVDVDSVTVVHDSNIPRYTGDYEVTPQTVAQVLPTGGKLMTDDVDIRAIPYWETSNQSGGITAIIGRTLDDA